MIAQPTVVSPVGNQSVPPSELTRGLLNALDRPAIASITPSTLGTVLAGLLTAGIYPAVALPRKWSRTLRWHENILWHLAEWAKVNIGSEQGQRLHAAASGCPPMFMSRLAALCGIGALIAMAVGVSMGYPLSGFWRADPLTTLDDPIFTTFHAGLLGAFALSWLSVNLHLRRLRRARAALEQTTPQLAPTAGLRVARWEWGIRPVPLVLGLLLALAGFVWALPMLIAATAQRRALLIHHRRLRGQMAHRVRELIDRRRPAVAMPPVIDRVGVCRNAVCDEHLPLDAQFCARCGMPQGRIGRALS